MVGCDVQLMRGILRKLIRTDPEGNFTPTNWRRLVAPWEDIAELGRAEGIEVALEAWR